MKARYSQSNGLFFFFGEQSTECRLFMMPMCWFELEGITAFSVEQC